MQDASPVIKADPKLPCTFLYALQFQRKMHSFKTPDIWVTGSWFFNPFQVVSLCHFSQGGCRPVFVHQESHFQNTLYYNTEQSEQILKRKLEARRKCLFSHLSHAYHESIFPAPSACVSLLFNAWKLCLPLPCWLTELGLPVSPSRITARKLLQCNLKTIKHRTSRWQVTSPSHEQPMSLWHCPSACWAKLTKSKQEASAAEMMSVKATSHQHRPYDCDKEFGHWQEALVTMNSKYLLLR